MQKYFNIAGPCNKNDHYMLSVIERNNNIQSLIDQKQYFVIHAARQTGKTTLIQELVSNFNSGIEYYALYCSLESASVFTDAKIGIPQIINVLKSAFHYSNLPNKDNFAENIIKDEYATMIGNSLKDYCAILKKPLILFFDEIDSLQDETLVAFLRQLRDGYITRSQIPFVHSIVLVGMRNIRDYKVKIREGQNTLGSSSPFNIITKVITLQNFSLKEVEFLYHQHAYTTGQVFEPTAIEQVYLQTDGQPWLVNAVAREIIVEILKNNNSVPITVPLVEEAIQNIILRRDTHIDSLLDKLKEERIRRIIQPILLGNLLETSITNDDVQYCLNLGILSDKNKILQPANNIYKEVIIRSLNNDTQFYLHTSVKNVWIKNNQIDMNGLLKGFQQFWRENSEIWVNRYEYREAAPHLILQAFLQRIINGGGHIIREYAANRGRMDLCVVYSEKKYIIELKLLYNDKTIPQGLGQIAEYMDIMCETEGWLIVFDRDEKKSYDEKIYWNTQKVNNKTIHILGC